MLHLEHAQSLLVDLLQGNSSDHPHCWHKPRRGRCKYCALRIIWIFTERDHSYPFDLRENDAFRLPQNANGESPRSPHQRPGTKPSDQVLIPHLYVCLQREASDSTALQRIRGDNCQRASDESDAHGERA